ncbi:MAG: anthranilate phosphoribosyltransferase, partial [Desulfofustis sp.]|nr:anthranilate phosphoribosyltransferase [Desulfofustis sp.]
KIYIHKLDAKMLTRATSNLSILAGRIFRTKPADYLIEEGNIVEAAGVKLDLTAEQVSTCIKQAGIGFLFAPALHGAMKYAIGPRREIGIRTIFNILGPLTNPAGANIQVLGVFAEELTEQLAEVLGKLGSKRALVVHGEGRLDELTVTGTTLISELRDGKVTSYRITPEEVGLPRAALQALRGGRDSGESAVLMKDILSGTAGPRRDMVLLNSGAALLAAGAADDLRAGITLAAECIDSGRAARKLQELVELSNSFAP